MPRAAHARSSTTLVNGKAGTPAIAGSVPTRAIYTVNATTEETMLVMKALDSKSSR